MKLWRWVSTGMLGLMLFIGAKSSAPGAEAAPDTAPATRQVLYSINFEDGKGVFQHGGKFTGTWSSNEEKEARLSLETPLGTGNNSKLALTIHAVKGAPYISTETNIKGIIVEPQGWDGGLKFRIYNGGFAKLYALYLPVMPSDITYHRAYFEAPKGQWTDIDLPLDKFLFHGKRPRRGCTLELISIVGEGPEGDDSVFQFDDLELYQTKEANPPKPRPVAALSPGVRYFQNFDDPANFDIQAFYPATTNANAFRVTGGTDASGAVVENPKDEMNGCLKIECYAKHADFKGGRQIAFPAAGTNIEFDVLTQDAADVGLMFRSAKTRGRQYLSPQPKPGVWTHYAVSAEEFAPYGTEVAEGKEKKLSRDEQISMLFFTATSGDASEHALLVDNVAIRSAPRHNLLMESKFSGI